MSYTNDYQLIRLELFRLIAMIFSSKEIAILAEENTSDYDRLRLGGYQPHWLQSFATTYFHSELSRILLYTAITCRTIASNPYFSEWDVWKMKCGTLERKKLEGKDREIGAGALGGSLQDLSLKEAFNKLIHAEVINPDIETINGDDALFSANYINPKIYIYGRRNSEVWRATLEIQDYVRLINSALPRES